MVQKLDPAFLKYWLPNHLMRVRQEYLTKCDEARKYKRTDVLYSHPVKIANRMIDFGMVGAPAAPASVDDEDEDLFRQPGGGKRPRH